MYCIFHVEYDGEKIKSSISLQVCNNTSILLLQKGLRKATKQCHEGTLSTTNCPKISTSRIFLQSHDICHDSRGNVLKKETLANWLLSKEISEGQH
jgi:hypothetical protein